MMSERKYPFSQVDAFTLRRLSGNPCAVVFDADDLSDSKMLAIAREMNLSETAFVLKSTKADFRFRYFTPAEEIPLAGHPTIATVFRLLETGKIPAHKTTLKIELQAGIIEVRIEQDTNAARIIMRQLPPQFLGAYNANEILPLFGLESSELLPGHLIQTVSTGTPMLMIPLKDVSSLDKVQFDTSRFSKYRAHSDFFSAHLFTLNEDGTTSARHFCSPPDVIEDPFTGSATGAMGCYLWKYGLMEKPEFLARQGAHLQRPGEAKVKILGSREAISRVEVSGHAVTCMQGELFI
jgi:trans-2,3-dihydro-3-hydroxyanthranilate isomerase